LGKFIPKITNICDFGTYKSTFLKATTVKFAVTWDTLPVLNFVKIAQKNAQGAWPVLHYLRGDAYWFLVVIAIVIVKKCCNCNSIVNWQKCNWSMPSY